MQFARGFQCCPFYLLLSYTRYARCSSTIISHDREYRIRVDHERVFARGENEGEKKDRIGGEGCCSRDTYDGFERVTTNPLCSRLPELGES